MNHDNDVFVYLIAAQSGREDGPVKIGIAENPERRLRDLQTASPFPLVLIHTFAFPTRAIAREMESQFHTMEVARKAVGEWFSINPIEALFWLWTCIGAVFDIRMPSYLERARIRRLSGLDSAQEKLERLSGVKL